MNAKPLVISGRRDGKLVAEPPFHELIGVSRILWEREFDGSAVLEFVAPNGEPVVYVEVGYSAEIAVFARRD